MEFLELLEQIMASIPPEYADTVRTVNAVMPWIVLSVSLAVCFFGYQIHHLWAALAFFGLGFTLCVFVGAALPHVNIYLIITLGLAFGILGIVLSRKLLKLEIFFANFFLVYTALPTLLGRFLEPTPATLIGLVAAITVGVVAVKFKFIVTITTSACTGAATAVPILMSLAGWQGLLLRWALIAALAAVGLFVQFFMEKRVMAREKAERVERKKAREAARKTSKEQTPVK